jgi:hypothetical protein
MALLDLAIVAGVFSIALHLWLIILLNWVNLTIPQVVGITACLVWALSFLFNAKLWTLKKAAIIGVGSVVLSTLVIAQKDCAKCTVDTFIITIAVIGSICIAATLAQGVVAYLIKKENGK